jgi:hypothetical protein
LFNLKKLNGIEDGEQYDVRISSRFAALENLDGDMELIDLEILLE